MRNKFTKSASKALDNSLNVAKSFGHNYVGTEHLLIALVKTKGVASEVMRENGAYTIVVTKSMGRAAFRFIDAPYSKEWFVDGKNEVSADWSVIRTRVSESGANVSSLVTGYDMFRDIIFGNNRKPDLLQFRKYAIVESSRYQNIPRTIQNVFLNSKLDADFIKDISQTVLYLLYRLFVSLK